MDWFALTPLEDIPMLYLGIGCVLMAILGGFTSEFTMIVSVKHLFSVLLRSLFVGLLAFLVGLSLKLPWYLKLFASGLFGFIGIPSVLLITKRVISSVLSIFQYLDDITKEVQEKSKLPDNRGKDADRTEEGSDDR